MPDDFATVAETAIDDLLRLRPDVASWVGVHDYDDKLPDNSAAGMAEVVRTLRAHRESLSAVDTSALGVQEQVDAAILANALDSAIFDADVVKDHEWNLLAHEAGDPLYLLMSRDTVPLEQRVRGLAGRLAALPDFLATTRATVTRAPKIHAETALAQFPGLRGLITEELDRTLAGDAALTALISGPRETALACLDEHEAW